MIKVLSIGDNVIEKYPHANVMYPGGNIINFAAYSKQLGYETAVIAAFGSDLAAMHMKTVLMDLGIDISHSKDFKGKSRFAEVNIVEGERVFLNSKEDEKNTQNKVVLDNDDYEYLKGFDIIHSDIFSFLEEQIKNIAENNIVSFDFSDRWNDENLKTFCPHLYLSLFSCEGMQDSKIESLLLKSYKFGTKLALASMGPHGSILFDGSRFYRRKPISSNVVDSIGAGSAYISAFFCNYIEMMLRENEDISKIEQEDKENIIDSALSEAAFFAGRILEQDGPFGYPMDIVEEGEEDSKVVSLDKKLVIGVIGADVHAVGNKILDYAFSEAGFNVTNLGVMVSQEEFIDAAVETEADAIIVSSLYGHGELDARGLKEKCIEAGLEDVLLYIGGNLVVGVQDFSIVEKTFKEMGFDRVYSNKATPEDDIEDLKIDLKIK